MHHHHIHVIRIYSTIDRDLMMIEMERMQEKEKVLLGQHKNHYEQMCVIFMRLLNLRSPTWIRCDVDCMQLIEYKITNAPHVSAHKQMKPPPNCSLFIDSVAFFPSTVAHFGDGSWLMNQLLVYFRLKDWCCICFPSATIRLTSRERESIDAIKFTCRKRFLIMHNS